MTLGRSHRLAIAAVALTAAAAPQRVAIATLDHVSVGRWQLSEIGGTRPPRSLCVADPALLLQLRHGAAVCARFVIEASSKAATVHYTCPGAGHGRTTLTVESPTLLHIETQGIAGGQPFDLNMEARHAGAC